MHAATMKDKGKSAKGWSETSCLPFNSKYFKYYHLKEKRKKKTIVTHLNWNSLRLFLCF